MREFGLSIDENNVSHRIAGNPLPAGPGQRRENSENGHAGGHNAIPPMLLSEFVSRIENLHGEIATVKSAMMNDCKALHAGIRQVYIEAKQHGLNKKSLRAVIGERRLLRKAAELRENLEADEVDMFDMMKSALGELADTPLGQAAMASAAN